MYANQNLKLQMIKFKKKQDEKLNSNILSYFFKYLPGAVTETSHIFGLDSSHFFLKKKYITLK